MFKETYQIKTLFLYFQSGAEIKRSTRLLQHNRGSSYYDGIEKHTEILNLGREREGRSYAVSR